MLWSAGKFLSHAHWISLPLSEQMATVGKLYGVELGFTYLYSGLQHSSAFSDKYSKVEFSILIIYASNNRHGINIFKVIIKFVGKTLNCLTIRTNSAPLKHEVGRLLSLNILMEYCCMRIAGQWNFHNGQFETLAWCQPEKAHKSLKSIFLAKNVFFLKNLFTPHLKKYDNLEWEHKL